MKKTVTPQELAEYLAGKSVETVRYGIRGEGCSPFPFVYTRFEYASLSLLFGVDGWELHAGNEKCGMAIMRIVEASVNTLDNQKDVVTLTSSNGKTSYTHKLEIRYSYKPQSGKGKRKEGKGAANQ